MAKKRQQTSKKDFKQFILEHSVQFFLTIVSGVVLAFVIQDARFDPTRSEQIEVIPTKEILETTLEPTSVITDTLSTSLPVSEIPSQDSPKVLSSLNWCESSTRKVGDVNGDTLIDVIDFTPTGTIVWLAKEQGFDFPQLWSNSFIEDSGGWDIVNKHPVSIGDVNGDGLADAIGFGGNDVFVALSNGNSFQPITNWLANNFGYNQNGGAWKIEKHFRTVADLNGDDKADLVGFGDDGVYVSLSDGASFSDPKLWTSDFGFDQNWDIYSTYRQLADVNGDNKSDIVLITIEGNGEVFVALSTGGNFTQKNTWGENFYELPPEEGVEFRPLVFDTNDDSMADLFTYMGYFIYLSEGTKFSKSPDTFLIEQSYLYLKSCP